MSESLIQDLQAKLNSAEAARRRLEEENKVFFFSRKSITLFLFVIMGASWLSNGTYYCDF